MLLRYVYLTQGLAITLSPMLPAPQWKYFKPQLSPRTWADLPCLEAPAPGAASGQVAREPGAKGRSPKPPLCPWACCPVMPPRPGRGDAPPHCGNAHNRHCHWADAAGRAAQPSPPGQARRRATRRATRATPLWKRLKPPLSPAAGADLPCQEAPAPGAASGQVAQEPGAKGRSQLLPPCEGGL